MQILSPIHLSPLQESKSKPWIIQLSFPEGPLWAGGLYPLCQLLSVLPGALGHRDASDRVCSWGSTLWPSDRQPPTQAASRQTQAGTDDVLTTSTALRPLLRLPTSFSSSARLGGWGGAKGRERSWG